jgi:methylthioribose-1-phosphate isomerase
MTGGYLLGMIVSIPSPIDWTPDHRIRILDQTRLPDEEVYLDLGAVEEVAEAIRSLRVRGAPLIGIAAAMGVAVAVGRWGSGEAGRSAGGLDTGNVAGSASSPRPRVPAAPPLTIVREACTLLGATRPTAVNLHWALKRMERRAEAAAGVGEPLDVALVAEANAIWDEDRAMCRRIGELGANLIPEGGTIATICNAGALATGGIGTALAPIYLLYERGIPVQTLVPETRPLLQGSRLTAWELHRAGVPVTLIGDGMIASRLRRGDVRAVLVGADRIAANGDVANKIGTYGLALAARAHRIPFYVAAPSSTVDPSTPEGSAIPIEERAPGELTGWRGHNSAPAGIQVWNPAFDVTPAELVTAIITDRAVLPPRDIVRTLD